MSNFVKLDLKTIGGRIKILRILDDPHQNQGEFGAKIGYSSNMISKIERGRSEPTATFLYRLSELTGKSIDWILRGDA